METPTRALRPEFLPLRHNNLLTAVHPTFILGQPMELEYQGQLYYSIRVQYVLYLHSPRAPAVYSEYADSDSGSTGR